MEFEKLHRNIKKSIEEYISGLDHELMEEIEEIVDAEDLSNFILKNMEEHVYKFETEDYGDDFCSTCQKNFGDFVSVFHRIEADDLLKKNIKIILD